MLVQSSRSSQGCENLLVCNPKTHGPTSQNTPVTLAADSNPTLAGLREKKQTGVCMDRTNLSKRGVRPMKQMLFLMAARATTLDCEWARIYQSLLPRLCTYDERVSGKEKGPRQNCRADGLDDLRAAQNGSGNAESSSSWRASPPRDTQRDYRRV